jgi:hypothetical protein
MLGHMSIGRETNLDSLLMLYFSIVKDQKLVQIKEIL